MATVTPTAVKVAPALKAQASARALKGFEVAFEQFGRHAYPRAVTFSLNGIAMDAKRRLRNVLRDVLENPQPWTLRAVEYELASLKPFESGTWSGKAADVSARVYIKNRQGDRNNDQASVLKYLWDDQSPTRFVGDVGPGRDFIWIPVTRNLREIEGVQPVGGEGMPKATLKRLLRQAKRDVGPLSMTKNAVAKRAAQDAKRTDGGLFFGRPASELGLGIWSRPKARWSKATHRRIVDRAPKMLVRAATQAEYKPMLAAPWKAAVGEAYDTLPRKLAKELARETKFAADRAKAAGGGS